MAQIFVNAFPCTETEHIYTVKPQAIIAGIVFLLHFWVWMVFWEKFQAHAYSAECSWFVITLLNKKKLKVIATD